jgi:hypothetical protein
MQRFLAANMTPLLFLLPITKVRLSMYGPWTLTERIFYRDGTGIYATPFPRWVVKVFDGTDELANLLRLRGDCTPPNMIELPMTLYSLYGRNEMTGWYAMRRYDGHVEVDDEWCTQNWLAIGRASLLFLRGLHIDHHLVHMDIKLENILIDRAQATVVVADYDLMTHPSTKPLIDYDVDRIWYFLMMGAEPAAPLHSYRLDLTALGYALARLSWPVDAAPSTFRAVCTDHRKNATDTGVSSAAVTELIELRARDMQAAHPTIRKYLDIVGRVDWASVAPPPVSLYDELLTLFQ